MGRFQEVSAQPYRRDENCGEIRKLCKLAKERKKERTNEKLLNRRKKTVQTEENNVQVRKKDKSE